MLCSAMQFAPALHPTLIHLIGELDDGSEVIAAIWRELGRRARAQQLLQPSYETVRRLVHVQRAWRRLLDVRLRRAAIFAADYLLKARNRKATLLTFDGAEIARRQALYRTARSRAPASAAQSPSGTASPHGGP